MKITTSFRDLPSAVSGEQVTVTLSGPKKAPKEETEMLTCPTPSLTVQLVSLKATSVPAGVTDIGG